MSDSTTTKTPNYVRTLDDWSDLIRDTLCPAATNIETALRETKEGLDGNTTTTTSENSTPQIGTTTRNRKTKPHPIHVAATEWRHADLEELLTFYPHRYPMEFDMDGGYGRSLGSSFDYPLHACILSIRRKAAEFHDDCTGAGSDPFRSTADDGGDGGGGDEGEHPSVRTLRILLDHGLEPNERLERVDPDTDFSGLDDPNGYVGFTPLQLLVGAARDTLSDTAGSERKERTNAAASSAGKESKAPASHLATCAEVLIRYGGRLSMDPPPTKRRNRSSPAAVPKTEEGGGGRPPAIDRGSVRNVEKDDGVVGAFGGRSALGRAQARWVLKKPVTAPEDCEVYRGNASSSPIVDCGLPGGSDATNCAVCWKNFTIVRNRKHLCKLSRRYVCEDCSSKVVLTNPPAEGNNGKTDRTSHRVSDGQFNYLVSRVETKKERDRAERREQTNVRRRQIETLRAAAAARNDASAVSAAEPAQRRNDLFVGPAVIGKTFLRLFADCSAEEKTDDDPRSGSVEERPPPVRYRFGGVTPSLGHTKDAFAEREDRLNAVGDKTLALKDACLNYSNFAKKLKGSQGQRWGGQF